MPKIAFSPLLIKNLKPSPTETVEYFDLNRDHGTGSLGFRITPKGRRSWFILYKGQTKKLRRYPLGEYPNLTLKDARSEALKVMTRVNKNEDPTGERQEYLKAPLMVDLWNLYKEEQQLLSKKKALSTTTEEIRRWENIIEPEIGGMKVVDVEPKHIAALLSKVAKRAPVSANRLYTFIRTLFKTALQHGWIKVHPMQWLNKPGGSERPRKRVLTDEEIRKIWPCFDALRPNPRDILCLGLLTAQRPGEIMSMKWSDIDIKGKIWRQEDTKNGVTHLVPLSAPVMDIILRRNAKKGDSENPWVFPSTYNKNKGAIHGRAKTTKDARKKVQDLSGVTGWTAHDLRRTARTLMSRLQIDHHIRERVLNHVQGGVVGVYDQYDYLNEKRDALDKLAEEILAVLRG